jgi:hypothetical protein
MRLSGALIVLTCCLFSVALSAQARKPGLWEITTNMTFQQSPFPQGMAARPGSPFGGPHTSQVCITQEQIDKYGAPISEQRDCQVTNISKSATGMRAEMVCTGAMNGKGTLEASFLDGAHTKSKVHFAGTMQAGPQGPKPVEWTSESSSTYKGPDCGSVKPMSSPR